MPPSSGAPLTFNGLNVINNGIWNAWVFPTASKNISSIIRGAVHYPFRKLEIKRRQISDALYEANWQDITKYVTSWGTYQSSLDAQRINQFVFSGLNVQVKNYFGEFNPEYDGPSLWYGYFTRYRTLVRLSAGYTDGAGNQFPTDATQGIFIMDADIDIAPQNKNVAINCKSIISPFQETKADEIDGIDSSITASEIIEKIRDATDGTGNFLFRNFITSTAWDIQTTTSVITGLGTTTTLAEFTVWELMNKLAEAEGFAISTTRAGGIVFGDRSPNTDDPVFNFYGAGYRDPNVIRVGSYKEATDKLYTDIRFQFLAPDTFTSFIEFGTQTTIDIRSNAWKYGRRVYEFENTFFSDTLTAQNLTTKILQEFGNLRNELVLDALFIPHLNILDRVAINHREGTTSSVHLWDFKDWAADTTTSDGPNVLFWASETSSSIEFNQKNFKILAQKTNLDNFTTTFTLREVEN